jgi:defect-in-organelle-trafficking protein DotC
MPYCKYTRVFSLGALLALLLGNLGCANNPRPVEELEALTEVKAFGSPDKMDISSIRFNTLRDAALGVGARAGLAYRAETINTTLNQYERPLERIFNFNPLMLESSILPPVLVEARNQLEQSSHDTLRIADRGYTIYAQARFISVAPTWRDYLFMHYAPPELPDRSLLPKDEVERKIWDRYVKQGWEAGVEQANTIFAENMGRIKRDMEGMIRYRVLLAKKMVSPPFVAKMDMGVTGGGDSMSVNDRMLRITAMPALQTDAEQWESKIKENTNPIQVITP